MIIKALVSVGQWLTNYWPPLWPNPSLPGFINKVLLEHRHIHSFMYCLWLLLQKKKKRQWKSATETTWPWPACKSEIFSVWSLLSLLMYVFRSDQSLSRVRLFATPWIAARQASLSITNSRSSPRLTSIESVMPSSHLILWSPSQI